MPFTVNFNQRTNDGQVSISRLVDSSQNHFELSCHFALPAIQLPLPAHLKAYPDSQGAPVGCSWIAARAPACWDRADQLVQQKCHTMFR